MPATVVMPTGTGKTDTMIALLVAARLTRLLVLVPSDALRDQLATAFLSLGVMQRSGIIASTAMRPSVGVVRHKFNDEGLAVEFADASNVIVATPHALRASDPGSLHAILERCSHLFVDEAHHVAAYTWASVREAFAEKRVVQFTATPFREDGRQLQGRIIYSFPLREAQAQGYFSKIDYTSVVDFDDADGALAAQATARLRLDIAAGFDHVLMARVGTIGRVADVGAKYQALAPDLNPVAIYNGMAKRDQRAAIRAIRDGTSRIIVCVNMLGEGFDLPTLKVAAIHDRQQSLAITLQFVGRFARTSSGSNLGSASVFVSRNKIDYDSTLRELFSEDADWNLVLRNLSEAAIGEEQEASDFLAGFSTAPEEVTLHSLLPKFSTVVYRTPTNAWDPQKAVEFFGEASIYTVPIGVNATHGVAWFVLEKHDDVRWGTVRTIEDVSYELYVLHFDTNRRLLYINNSANDGVFEDLAKAVAGDGVQRFTGSAVYRVMADITRLVPTTVGVVDARDQFRRFSMYVGSDVTASFSQAEAGTKTQTNISGGGYRGGEYVNISASLKGRIWSYATAHSLKQWMDWCTGIGTKLLDDTISIDTVIGQFILPQELDGRPSGVLLGVEWPWFVHVNAAESLSLGLRGTTTPAAYADLVPDVSNTGAVFRFTVRTGDWDSTYEASVVGKRLRYRATGTDEVVVTANRTERPLSEWLNEHGLLFVLSEDRILVDDLIYKPNWDRPPYDSSNLITLDWTGIDLAVESQTKDKLANSIQRRALGELMKEPWDVVIDDDGPGEIADIVALRIEPDGLLVRLVHCKYSSEERPGARVADLYEVCGQAQKSIQWRRSDLEPFFRALDERSRQKRQREGVSPYEVGDVKALYRLRDTALGLRRRIDMVIAQPGLSKATVSIQQLDLLASTENYLRTTINAPLAVWCSP